MKLDLCTYRKMFVVVFGVNFGKAPNLQSLCSLQEVGQLFLTDVHLAVVHEPEESLHVFLCDIPEYDDGMFARVGFEKATEVRTARGQDHLVCCEGTTVAGQCHVDKVFLLSQVPER